MGIEGQGYWQKIWQILILQIVIGLHQAAKTLLVTDNAGSQPTSFFTVH
jgi:hypothetical protein